MRLDPRKVGKQVANVAITIFMAIAIAALRLDELLSFTELTVELRARILISAITGLVVFLVMTIIYSRIVNKLEKDRDFARNELARYKNISREVGIAKALDDRFGNRE